MAKEPAGSFVYAQDSFADGQLADFENRGCRCTVRLLTEGLMARSLEDVQLYGEMHRFIPIYASRSGARVTEIRLSTMPHDGQIEIRFARTIKVVFDLMTIKFMASYQTKPLYMFGSAGLLTFAIAFFCAVFAFLMKFASWPHHADFIQTPLPVLTMVPLVLGCNFSSWVCWQRCWCGLITSRNRKRSMRLRERGGFTTEDTEKDK
jgi:hypothetical protein